MDIVSKVAYKPHEIDINEYRIRQQSYRDLFQTPAGEVVLRDLLQFCKYSDLSITDSPSLNAHILALKSVIQHIEEMCEAELVDIAMDQGE